MSDEQKWEKSSSSGKPSTLGQTQKEFGLRVIFFFSRLLNFLDQMLAVMVLSQHQVSSSKTVRPQGPCGARCVGHTRTWSSTCSVALHSQFNEGARPHFCMDELNRLTPVCTRLNLTRAIRDKPIPTGEVLILSMKAQNFNVISQHLAYHL